MNHLPKSKCIYNMVQAQRVACLARQSSRGLALDDQQTPPPRWFRQRSRLIDNQTNTNNHQTTQVIFTTQQS